MNTGEPAPGVRHKIRDRKWQYYTKQEIDEVLELRRQGLTLRQVAERMGRPYRGIENKFAGTTNMRWYEADPDKEARLISMYEAGEKLIVIAAELGITERQVDSSVARLCRRGMLERRYLGRKGNANRV